MRKTFYEWTQTIDKVLLAYKLFCCFITLCWFDPLDLFLVSFHYSYKRIKSPNNWIILHMYHIFSIPTVFEVSFFVLVKVLNFQRSRLSVHILYVYCFASLSTCYFLKPIALASVWLTECIHHHMTVWGIGHSQTSLSLAEFTVLINMWFSKA